MTKGTLIEIYLFGLRVFYWQRRPRLHHQVYNQVGFSQSYPGSMFMINQNAKLSDWIAMQGMNQMSQQQMNNLQNPYFQDRQLAQITMINNLANAAFDKHFGHLPLANPTHRDTVLRTGQEQEGV